MARRTLAQLARLVVYVLVFFFWGCSSQGNGKSFLSGLLHRIHANRAPAQLSPWSWLPSSNAKAAELATIPPGAQLELSIPEKNPISTHSEAPGGIDSSLNFVPTV